MRVLLDTNIVIHRENKKVSNYSIGHLFRWIDRLKYDKIIHPYTIREIQKYRDPETQEAISVKLESYEVIKTICLPDDLFLSRIGQAEKNENDHIDNYMRYIKTEWISLLRKTADCVIKQQLLVSESECFQ